MTRMTSSSSTSTWPVLMKAAEAAIATGRGRLELGSGGIAVGSGSAQFATVTLTYSDPAGGGLALAA